MNKNDDNAFLTAQIAQQLIQSTDEINNNENQYEAYFRLHEKYSELYGKQTVVLYENGTFFEIYGIEYSEKNKQNKCGVCLEVATLLNILFTSKDKKKTVNIKNPNMCGFQPPYLKRHLDVLIQNNWTVVIVEQITEPPKPKRGVTRIYSPGTYEFNNEEQYQDNNYLISLYFDKLQNEYNIGLSAIDISTGESYIYQLKLHDNNINKLVDNINHFLNCMKPREIIINHHNRVSKEQIKNILGFIINENNVLIQWETMNNTMEFQTTFHMEKYQNMFLNKIFNNLSTEYYVRQYNNATKSLILLIQYINQHMASLIKDLNVPIYWQGSSDVLLYHNTLYQLDMISNNICQYTVLNNRCKINSLYSVINKTRTPMGARLLRNHLMHPIFDIKELNKRYSFIDTLMSNKYLKKIDDWKKQLWKIGDMGKRYRKIVIGNISPQELFQFGNIIKNSIELIEPKYSKLWNDYNIDKDDISQLTQIYDDFLNTFDLTILEKYGRKNIDANFFKSGNYPELDEMYTNIINMENKIEEHRIYLAELIEKGKNNIVTLEHTESDGYYYKVATKRRSDILKYKISKDTNLSNIYELRGVSIKSSITKIFLKDKLFYKYKASQDDIGKPVLQCFDEYCKTKMINGLFNKIIDFIAKFDVVCSHCQCNLEYNYSKPNLINNDENGSHIDVKTMRHPIVERILQNTIYVPHDMCLNNEQSGMLLYGVNAAGKSCLLKALGLNVIMAQIGMYVACEQMTLSPFKRIFTRICGNDNMFQGESSFTVEMKELQSVINDGDKYSLILGDEICKGTEYISGLAIVSASLKLLLDKNMKFIFATHLHRLVEIPCVKVLLNKLLLKHLSIKYDSTRGIFIFDRKLENGSGNNLYGLEMARYIIGNQEFYNDALMVRDELLNEMGCKQMIISDQRSTYNSDIIMDECQICKKRTDLDVHHIIYQSNCKDNYDSHKGHVSKNSPGNLVVLCKKHHQDVHSNKLVINGYKNTNEGTILDYC